MFFIARTVAAMLIGFCGSKRTTTTESRRDSLIGETDGDELRSFVAVAAEVDEVAAPAAENQLATTSFAAERLFDDQNLNCLSSALGDFDVERISL